MKTCTPNNEDPPLFPSTDLVGSDRIAGGQAQSMPRRIVLACLLISAFCLRAWGQFSIDWYKVSSGGGTSTGGVYAVSGTIGQPDAGMINGGNFTLAGGFWAVVAAVQAPGAPSLDVTCTQGTVTVSWPLPATGWVLDQTPTLTGSPPPWTQVSANQYQTNATHCFIAVQAPLPSGSQFYRLRQTNP